jgi:transposase
MRLTLTETERTNLQAVTAAERRVRRWKRAQAVLLRADGLTVEAVARALGCSQASVYAWTVAWRQHGVAGLREGDHGGGPVKLDGTAAALLARLLEQDPQTHGHRATGWTVALLRTELAHAGVVVAEKTVRRGVHRLGYRWKRPRYILGRPDPAYAEKRGA